MQPIGLVIADAGPLIGLARIGRVALLHRLFHQVTITAVVAEEIGLLADAREAEDYPGLEQLQESLTAGWLRVVAIETLIPFQPLNPGVDAGEASSIALALALRSTGTEVLLLIDDRCGRAEARRHDLPLIGTAAVLLLAKEQGHIDACRPLLDALIEEGYWFSEPLIRAVLEQAAEEFP